MLWCSLKDLDSQYLLGRRPDGFSDAESMIIRERSELSSPHFVSTLVLLFYKTTSFAIVGSGMRNGFQLSERLGSDRGVCREPGPDRHGGYLTPTSAFATSDFARSLCVRWKFSLRPLTQSNRVRAAVKDALELLVK